MWYKYFYNNFRETINFQGYSLLCKLYFLMYFSKKFVIVATFLTWNAILTRVYKNRYNFDTHDSINHILLFLCSIAPFKCWFILYHEPVRAEKNLFVFFCIKSPQIPMTFPATIHKN